MSEGLLGSQTGSVERKGKDHEINRDGDGFDDNFIWLIVFFSISTKSKMRLLHQQRGGNIMNWIKCIAITVLLIIGPLSFSVAGEVKIPAEKAEAFTVDPATGNRTDLVFNKRSHRWEVPISSLERAINPLAVNMPDSFFIRDPKTGSAYPVRWEPYHEYAWGMDDRSSLLKNPPVEFIADYYPPGEYTPPGGWPYPSEGGVSPPNSTAKPPHGEWQIPVFKGERQTGSGTDKDYSRPSGAINPRTGEHYPSTGKGVFDPKTGAYFPPTGSGFFNPKTGEFYPSVGGPKEKNRDVDRKTQTRPQSQWQIPTRGESVDESQWQIPVFKRRR